MQTTPQAKPTSVLNAIRRAALKAAGGATVTLEIEAAGYQALQRLRAAGLSYQEMMILAEQEARKTGKLKA